MGDPGETGTAIERVTWPESTVNYSWAPRGTSTIGRPDSCDRSGGILSINLILVSFIRLCWVSCTVGIPSCRPDPPLHLASPGTIIEVIVIFDIFNWSGLRYSLEHLRERS
jgi:hypothetical protein